MCLNFNFAVLLTLLQLKLKRISISYIKILAALFQLHFFFEFKLKNIFQDINSSTEEIFLKLFMDKLSSIHMMF
jgi:hypothetical protein